MTRGTETTGTDRRSDRTKAAILRAAQERFAAQGYERTTIRAVASDAGIDPSMVMRYFGSKAHLFDATLAIDLRLPDLTSVPADETAQALVRHFLARWEGDPADDALLVLLRSAVTNEQAAARMHEIFAAQVAPALAAVLGPGLAAHRAGLVSAQLLGLGLTRYLLRLPAVTALTPDEIEAGLAPAIQAVLAPS
ncbi:TetR/AcrR family transcriptional regulator [Streptomyces stelliscabiei]|uniref:TetR/AcrR family transcriptional regulator n=1 Tax=Streptomyces stelliscabiei TaxID=146820 RepID=UPI0029A61134|nr:TetR family transcriptional regulator [Streptomyces stelliscabiei]MDX2550439.1 TetR family transcriptional regulator [Streptomyces stelliscabiei]MDX2610137.1 TetR family transcriptional regulator [Streptomyces stelliscabiei]MDX2634941.1 TetR family transcriptional regulator [Streptomyces stelliscabiei]MDX2659887.1 TetR family transcriptional regulator [Streptomyces stelliscabiei]MDX2711419.1 TetR family transcriptional regulator [Streptomyces stelliscabiei]